MEALYFAPEEPEEVELEEEAVVEEAAGALEAAGVAALDDESAAGLLAAPPEAGFGA